MSGEKGKGQVRVLLTAPVGADAANIRDVLASADIVSEVLPSLEMLAAALQVGCGAVVVTEDAFLEQGDQALAGALSRQPAWSDIPVLLIVSGRRPAENEAAGLLRRHATVTLIERPLHRETLISAVKAALRARQRQYEVRDLLAEREELLANLEQRVTERTAKLQELNAELEAFSYSISHDLRAPLRSMQSFASLLWDDYADNLPPEGRDFVQRISKNATKMDTMMQDVLSFTRLTRSQMPLTEIDLDTVVADTLEQYPDLTAARSRIQVESPLGIVIGHTPSLMQCLSNLMQNALKFAAPNRPAQVEVFAQASPGHVRLNVRDNGIGIDPAQHARIFELFERAGPVNIPGTGLGLAIVRKAVERMGGRVGVSSVLGNGSCFWLDLKAPDCRKT